MKEREGYITLTNVAEKDGDAFVAACLELGAVASGETIEEAFESLDKAVRMQLKALEEAGERERVFRENGIEVVPSIDNAEVQTRMLAGDKVLKISRHEVAIRC